MTEKRLKILGSEYSSSDSERHEVLSRSSDSSAESTRNYTLLRQEYQNLKRKLERLE